MGGLSLTIRALFTNDALLLIPNMANPTRGKGTQPQKSMRQVHARMKRRYAHATMVSGNPGLGLSLTILVLSINDVLLLIPNMANPTRGKSMQRKKSMRQ